MTAVKAVTATVTALTADAVIDPGHPGRAVLALDTRGSSAADTTRATGAPSPDCEPPAPPSPP